MLIIFTLLVLIFAGVALMVVVSERFARSDDEPGASRLYRWIVPLVGLLLVLRAVDYFFLSA